MKRFYSYVTNKLNLQINGRKYSTRRKKPVDPSLENKLPIYNYPKAAQSDRRVYVWGFQDSGALGLPINDTRLPHTEESIFVKKNPKRHSFAEVHEVFDITAGYGFSAFAIKSKDNYKVFGTGLNTDSQIGYHAPRRSNHLELLTTPVPIHIPFHHPETTRVVSIAAGRAHLVIVSDNEGAYSLGNNSYGQCGRKIIPNENYNGNVILHHLPALHNDVYTRVVCGQDHSMLLTQSGNVYACGWGADGQLGRGNFETDYKLQKVTGDIEHEKIIQLSCAGDCILALNDRGEVFGWGNTEYGQLSIAGNKEHQINCPRVLKLNLGKIKDVAAGGSFCAVLTEEGDVYVWGFGILGLGPEVQRVTKPTKIPPILFGKNQFNPELQIDKLYAGVNQLAATSSIGDLFTWGKNKHGCLGLGHLKDQYFPYKCAIGCHVTKMCFGIDHALALCKPFV